MRLIQPINFLQMLQPNANPPYDDFVNRIVSYSDQQASVFLQVCQNAVHYRPGLRSTSVCVAKDEGRVLRGQIQNSGCHR